MLVSFGVAHDLTSWRHHQGAKTDECPLKAVRSSDEPLVALRDMVGCGAAACITPARLPILAGRSRCGPMTGRSSSHTDLDRGQQTTSSADDAAFTSPPCARHPQGSEQSST